jgi:hypothetical protein
LTGCTHGKNKRRCRSYVEGGHTSAAAVKLLQQPFSRRSETRATPTTHRIKQDSLPQPTLYLAFELGQNTWKLGFTIGVAQPPRERMIPAGDVEILQQEIARAKQRFGLPEDARVVSCYEAGRDGFWLHRYLKAQGVMNHVIDSASIEVNRRQRRAKTDRLDVRKLLTMLLRHMAGEKKVWSVVRVPSVDEGVSHLLHTKQPSHLRAFLDKLGNVKGEVLDRLIDLNVVLPGGGRPDAVVAFLQPSQQPHP